MSANKKSKVLSFVMAILFSVSALASCDSGTEQDTDIKETYTAVSESATESENETAAVAEAMPDVEKKDYDSEFFLWIMSGVSNNFDYYFVEEGKNDVLTEAIFARQQKIYEHLGVEIVGSGYPDFATYTTPFKTAVKNKDGSVDMLLSHVYYGVPGLITGNFLTDLGSVPGINLSADYWNEAFMDDLSLSDKYYLGFSDFNILYTHVITFNKTMMDKYADAVDKSLYDMVRDYDWTIDQMLSLASLVHVDVTSDGKTADDIYGLTGRQWSEFPGFLHACNINIIEQDDSGEYKLAFMNEVNAPKTTALIDKLHELSKSDYAYFDYKTNDTPTVPFTTGRTLLHLSTTISLASFLDYDISFGVLPYPLWDSGQKDVGYRAFNYDGYITFPSYMRNENMSVETVEILSFFSDPVQSAYYEKQLGKQAADTPDDREMLQLVWDGICTDFGLAYHAIDTLNLDINLYMLPTLTNANATANIASHVKSYEGAANKSIDKWMKTYQKKIGNG
jgi:hypothetical protein